MDDYITYISEFGAAFLIVFSPFAIKLYKELVQLRKDYSKTREKLAYFQGKYEDKVIFKSHGKKPTDLGDHE